MSSVVERFGACGRDPRPFAPLWSGRGTALDVEGGSACRIGPDSTVLIA